MVEVIGDSGVKEAPRVSDPESNVSR